MPEHPRAPGPLRDQLEFLVNGFGFYAQRERVRADDLLVRERAAAALGSGAAALRDLASAYRRRFVPEPSREQPLPPAGAMAALRAVEGARGEVADAEVRVRSQGFPASDRTWAWLRGEQAALDLALAFDHRLISEADAVQRACAALAPEALGPAPGGDPPALAPVRAALRQVLATLTERAAHLALQG